MRLAKTAEPIEMPFGLRTRVDPWNHVLDGVQIPAWEGTILGERDAHCKVYGHSGVNCAKTAEPIDLSFGCGLGWAKESTSSIVFARLGQCALMRGHIGATWQI